MNKKTIKATYSFVKIDQLNRRNAVTFYTYTGGCPNGAACYFWTMNQHIVNIRKNRWHKNTYIGSLADIFIKSNPESVILTESHDKHFDTEYQYEMDVNTGILVAKQVILLPVRGFKRFFKGHYADFMNQFNERLSKAEKYGYETLYLLDESLKGYVNSGISYLTLSAVKKQLLEIQHKVLKGYTQYEDQLRLWSQEYSRLKTLAGNMSLKQASSY